MSKAILFGAIASVLSVNSVFATSSTVTSKDYVDNLVGTKQAKIPAAGVNATANGGGVSVVTYTTTGNGTIGERGIFSGGTYTAGTDANKLVTASALNGSISGLPTIETSKMECVDSPDCTLWRVIDQEVYGQTNN